MAIVTEGGKTMIEGWAEVSLLGHVTIWGFVSTEYLGDDACFLIHTPELPEREVELQSSVFHGNGWLGVGCGRWEDVMSEKPKFTPGPWKVFKADMGSPCRTPVIEVYDQDGDPIVHWGGFDAAPQSKAKKVGNAYLISAAPIGYELAEMVIADPRSNDGLLAKAREFMRVAKGK